MTLRGRLLLLTAACLAARALTAPSYIQNIDGFLFVRGVVRYAVPEMRPHWPGYPVYVWAGKLLAVFCGDPTRSLRALSILSSTACLWPLASVARRLSSALGALSEDADRAGFGAALLWCLAPASWLVGTEIYSDNLGLLLGLGVLAVTWDLWEDDAPADVAGRAALVAAALGALMLGVRLAYLGLLAPLAAAPFSRRTRVRWAAVAAIFGVVVGAWFAWQLAMDGRAFFHSAQSHLDVHFSEKGNSAFSDPADALRPLVLARTTLAHDLGAWWAGAPLLRLAPTAALAALGVAAAFRLRRDLRAAAPLWLWAGAYALEILVGHDVAFTRYPLPLVAAVAVVAAQGLPRGRGAAAATALAALAIAVVSVPLAIDHRNVPPLAEQLARRLAGIDPRRSVLLIPNAERGIADVYLAMEVPALSVRTEQPTSEAAAREAGRDVYSLEPGADAPSEWVPLARFCRSHWIDSRTAPEMWLFVRRPGAGDFSVPGCAPVVREALPWDPTL